MTVRLIPHDPPPVVPATDLGGVVVLKAGSLVLLTDPGGDVAPDPRGLGLYAADTRIASCLRLLVDGQVPAVLRPDRGGAEAGTCLLSIVEVRRAADDRSAAATARHALAIERRRRLAGGLSEELAMTSFADGPREVRVEVRFDADLADLFEVRGVARRRRGRLGPIEVVGDAVTVPYEATDGQLVRVRATAPGATVEAAPPGSSGAVVLTWRPTLPPGGTVTLGWSVAVEESLPDAPPPPRPPRPSRAAPRRREPAARVRSSDPRLDRTVLRGLADLDLLVTPGPGTGERFLAAGVPWFTALFGRDAILAALAALPFDPSLAVDTLRVLARLQADADEPDRDAEPGKIPHEVRGGEMARTGEVVFGRYYGSADATPLWLVLLGETHDWTGDGALVEELWPNALRALAWVERHGDLDGDGFVEYRRRAPQGLVHHGWKDALDAIRDRTGRVADGPIALCEVQGYAYDARRRLARLARLRGDGALADRLDRAADRLGAAFDAAFWVPDLETYAIALDGAKRPADAVASNQGHALWSGIVPPARAAAVADRLTSAAMRSGWGLRTFAAGQPGYSPLGYHTGTVWPHDTAIAVAGLTRAGRHEAAALLAAELLDAAAALPEQRLPELYCGFDRARSGEPVAYPAACAPQAWAAAAPLLVVRSLLGLRADAPSGTLHVEHPRLPPGTTRLEVAGLRFAGARVDLRFRRVRDAVRVEVGRAPAGLEIRVAP